MNYIKIFAILIIVSLNSFAYDGVIKDKYGKVTGYISEKDGKVYIYNKYGKNDKTIESNKIKDKYGRVKGYIKK